MVQLDALKLVDKVRERLVDFALDTSYTRDAELNAICRALWAGAPEQGGLLSHLWVEGAFPAQISPYSLDDLVRMGLFDPNLRDHLHRRDAVPSARPLYTHQHAAIALAREHVSGGDRPALVVTAGTGAGKTESFLLPILNDLYREADHEPQGVKCLILYPMNALVNDQVDRLYSWLQGQDRVTLFHLTSETPEDRRAAERDGVPDWEPCRMRTRQEARGRETRSGDRIDGGRVPDILITNYSMLEYMLCRPQDGVFFGPALQAVVLDEAHLYTGTLAAEITLLLRRLLTRCSRKAQDVLQIATSATLGTGSADELREFASTIFTKGPDQVCVIQGQPQRVLDVTDTPAVDPEKPPTAREVAEQTWIDAPTLTVNEKGEVVLSEDPGLCDRLRDRLPLLVGASALDAVQGEQRPAPLLYSSLRYAPLIHRLEQTLWDRGRMRLSELTGEIWGTDDITAIRATIALLQIGASARMKAEEYPLVPHRLHVLARSSDGLVLCLNAGCSAPAGRHWQGLGGVSSGGQDRCPDCGSATIALRRCDNCGEVVLAAVSDMAGTLAPASSWQENATHYLLGHGMHSLTVAPATGRISGFGSDGVTLRQIDECPNCGKDRSGFVPFTAPLALALSVVTETALATLPPYPNGREWRPAKGRRLLAFSDSRSEAARLGPRLTRQHETQLVRAAIVRCLEGNPSVDDATLGLIRMELDRARSMLARSDLQPALRNLYEEQARMLEQRLTEATAGGSVGDWAIMLAKQDLLSEIIDPDYAIRHRADDWTQERWEENRNRIRKQARTFLALEFSRPSRQNNSLETLGLTEVTYPGLERIDPPAALIGGLPTEESRRLLCDNWTDFLAALCDSLRSDGAITLGSDDEDRDYPYGSILIGRWAAEEKERGWRLVRFIGATRKQRRCAFTMAVLRRCGLEEATLEVFCADVLRIAFHQLMEHATPNEGQAPGDSFPWLQRSLRQTKDGPPVDAVRLVFPGLGLRAPARLFRCGRTGHVFPRSVLGCGPETGCDGTLAAVAPEELDTDPRLRRVRREYREADVFTMGLWAEEHSAQLSPRENRRLQDLFKSGVRNILSATTTLELGIDIGGLSAVLMSNVPPGKANYLQRAGRAGRRADGSSLVLTFARPRPYDREVFHRIGDYLARPLRRPQVLLDRERVVRRHLHAYLLGRFFQLVYPQNAVAGAMNAFGRMGLFCGEPLPQKWERGVTQKPQMTTPLVPSLGDTSPLPWWDATSGPSRLDLQFRSFLRWIRSGGSELRSVFHTLFQGTVLEGALSDWTRLLDSVAEAFEAAIAAWRRDYEVLLDAWRNTEVKAQANALRYQMSAMWEVTVIEGLADRQFLPHYSFPIGVHGLRVIVPDDNEPSRAREEDQYRLERGGVLALREYVPGSQLLVGGRIITSRGLLKHWTGADLDNYLGLRGRSSLCQRGHFYYRIAGNLGDCPVCGEPPRGNARELLFPKHGFSSAAWDPPRRGAEIDRVGTAETATITFAGNEGTDLSVGDFGGVAGLTARYREDGELLVYNDGDNKCGFAICLKCGYADSERTISTNAADLPPRFLDHPPLTEPRAWKRCAGVGSPAALRNQTLAAREVTDILLLDFTQCLDSQARDLALVTTLGYALQQAGTRLLEMDSREIGVMSVPAGPLGESWGVVLYDTAPGGAGHVRHLMEWGADWLHAARDVMFIDEEHNARCLSACLDCLLSFDAQTAAEAGLLDRRRALESLEALLNGTHQGGTTEADGNTPPGPRLEQVERFSAEERLRRGQERMQRRR